jgi:metal-dependent HD superfamily phosphatase/phosphodiesterase
MTKDNINMTKSDIDAIAAKVVSQMVKLKSMEDWFQHVNKSDKAWKVLEDLDIDEEAAAFGELAKLMTLMDIFKNDEAYEKCAIIKNRLTEVKNILKKYNK